VEEDVTDDTIIINAIAANRIPVQSWAVRCMDGVFRSLMKTQPSPDPQLALAA
jgi:hypothetical protein